MGRRVVRVLVLAAALSALVPAAADAASPGQNGKLAYHDNGDVYSINLDATGRTRLTTHAGDDWAARWSPDGQRIAFLSHRDSASAVYVMNADGTSQTRLTEPTSGELTRATWSPDGRRLAFTIDRDIWMVDSDGSDLVRVTTGANVQHLDWSPDGSEIAFTAGDDGIDAMRPDGTDRRTIIPPDAAQPFSPGAIQAPDWSPDGSQITYTVYYECDGDACGEVYTAKEDGTQQTVIAEEWTAEGDFDPPSWSPDGTRIATATPVLLTMNTDGSDRRAIHGAATVFGRHDPDWQPLPADTLTDSHIRPKGASPFRVPLVPAAKPCTTPNREHGPPLAFGSCNPPQPGSSYLTAGVGDGSPALARSTGSVRMDVQLGAPGAPEDSDVLLRFSLTNVMRASDLSEYTGELRSEVTVRRTDRDGLGFAPHSTSMDFPFGFTVPCNPTPGSSLDASSCVSFTSVNAVIPGAVKDTHRAVWALDKLRVYDGGPDEDADTEDDNSLFMTQGVFVP